MANGSGVLGEAGAERERGGKAGSPTKATTDCQGLLGCILPFLGAHSAWPRLIVNSSGCCSGT